VYLTSKKLGVSLAYLKIISGLFAGVSQHCDKMKAYGRIHAKGKVLLSSEKTLADAKLELRLTTTTANFIAYVRFGSNTLLNVNENRRISNGWRKTKNLINYKKRLFRFRYRIFIYVGYWNRSVRCSRGNFTISCSHN